MERIANRRELAARLPSEAVGAELGVLDGLYSAVLLAEARPRLLHLVDLWHGQYGMMRIIGGREVTSINGDWARRQVELRLAGPITAGQVSLHQTDSVAWLTGQATSSLDWVYLDSDHSEPHVFRELCQSMRVVKPGGWICGHDYCAVCGGVVAAVDNFCRLMGQTLAIVTDEPEEPVAPAEWQRLPWLPRMAALNSYAIRLDK